MNKWMGLIVTLTLLFTFSSLTCSRGTPPEKQQLEEVSSPSPAIPSTPSSLLSAPPLPQTLPSATGLPPSAPSTISGTQPALSTPVTPQPLGGSHPALPTSMVPIATSLPSTTTQPATPTTQSAPTTW